MSVSDESQAKVLSELSKLQQQQQGLQQKIDQLLQLQQQSQSRSFSPSTTLPPGLPSSETSALSTSPAFNSALSLSFSTQSDLPVPSKTSSQLPSNSSSTARLSKGSNTDDTAEKEKAQFLEWVKEQAETQLSLTEEEREKEKKKDSQYSQRVILTTYPGQVGIHPIPLQWGDPNPKKRGPIVASRHPSSIKIRNAIGAYSGSYCIYKALAAAIGAVDPNHRPDFTDTEPPVELPPNQNWFEEKKIVSFDPWGHVAPTMFKDYFDAGADIRPTIAVTKAHIKLAEIDEAVKAGRIPVDGKVVIPSPPNSGPRGSGADAGIELNVTKAAIEPVWYLPGVAERFNIPENQLRRALFEDTGGMYPELLTRPDLKVFLPPIGGATVYIFGNPAHVRDETKELTIRPHDECNGSDVFGSDICTCRPYLLYGIEEAVKTAQRGGSGVIIYFRKEGRALGEVTKYLVYNARKRGGDSASMYFQRTENIAGVKDMRFQALMPDVLLWLGIKKIDSMISMSDMKSAAIKSAGIPILKQYEIPEDMIPPDSKVEIDAKIASGYWSAHQINDLDKTVGRAWEKQDWDDVLH